MAEGILHRDLLPSHMPSHDIHNLPRLDITFTLRDFEQMPDRDDTIVDRCIGVGIRLGETWVRDEGGTLLFGELGKAVFEVILNDILRFE